MSKNSNVVVEKSVVAGVDVGNGFVKVVGSYGEKELELTFPSGLELVVGTSESYFDKEKNEIICESIKEEGKKYKIIDIDCASSNYIATNYGTARYNSNEFQRLVEFVLAYVCKKLGSDKIKVVVGCPSTEKGTEREEQLRKAFEGNRVVKINNEEVTFKAEVLKVVAQPIGTVLNEVLNGNSKYSEYYIAIGDIGTGTLDLDSVKNLELVSSDRATFNDSGTYFVYEEIARRINNINPDVEANWKGVEKAWGNSIYKRSERLVLDFTEIKKEVIEAHVTKILSMIKQKWQNLAKFDIILFTGGAVEMKEYQEAIKKLAKDIIIVENPQIANAKGFYKYAKVLIEDETKE